jgi:hypothetical protein
MFYEANRSPRHATTASTYTSKPDRPLLRGWHKLRLNRLTGKGNRKKRVRKEREKCGGGMFVGAVGFHRLTAAATEVRGMIQLAFSCCGKERH